MNHEKQNPAEEDPRVRRLGAFLRFLDEANGHLKSNLVSRNAPAVQKIRDVVEEHYTDDEGRPAVYQKFESAFFDDARAIVSLWPFFTKYDREQLRQFQRMLALELQGLTGDRHPRSILARSPFGKVALVVGAISIWWAVIGTVSGEDMTEFVPELLSILSWAARIVFGVVWIGGMFTVTWYVVRTVRNHRQVASVSTIARAMEVYLYGPDR